MAAEWDQLPEEHDRAFSAFRIWLSLEPPRMNTKIVGAGYNRESVRNWKRKHRWAERSRAFDAFVGRRKLEEELAVNEAKNEDYGETINNSLRAKLSRLDSVLNRELQAIQDAQDAGQELDVLRTKRLLSAISEADSLARRSAAMPTAYRSKNVDTEPMSDETRVYFVGD